MTREEHLDHDKAELISAGLTLEADGYKVAGLKINRFGFFEGEATRDGERFLIGGNPDDGVQLFNPKTDDPFSDLMQGDS